MKAVRLFVFVMAAASLEAQSLDPKPSPTALLSQDELEPPPPDPPAAAAETTTFSGEAIRPIASPADRRSFRRLRNWGTDSRNRLRQVGLRHRAANAQRR